MRATQACPVELALDALGGKWRVVILARVKEGAQRYGDLRRQIPGMSDKMLTQRLRELVRAGLLSHDGAEYALTARGHDARPVLDALYAWGSALAPTPVAEPSAPRRGRGGSRA